MGLSHASGLGAEHLPALIYQARLPLVEHLLESVGQQGDHCDPQYHERKGSGRIFPDPEHADDCRHDDA
jgi:hypothetical protein